jgi:hypothetical protein
MGREVKGPKRCFLDQLHHKHDCYLHEAKNRMVVIPDDFEIFDILLSFCNHWSRGWELNPRPDDYESSALASELPRHDARQECQGHKID